MNVLGESGQMMVYLCPRCDDIHVNIGPVTVRLSPQQYEQLVQAVQQSAGRRDRPMRRSEAHDATRHSLRLVGDLETNHGHA